MSDVKILVACGSLRAGSVNAATMRAAQANVPDGVELAEVEIGTLPFYNGDVEEAGTPQPVVALHDALAAADGLMIFTPEYNASFPAVTKNAIDWLSRPPRSWTNRGLTLVVTTPGGRAGLGVREHFDAIMGHFPVKHHPAHGIGSYGDKLTDGELTDPDAVAGLREFVAAFAETCRSEAPAD